MVLSITERNEPCFVSQYEDAIRLGATPTLKAISTKDEHATLLHLAARLGLASVCGKIVSHGGSNVTKIASKSSWGTPLMVAVSFSESYVFDTFPKILTALLPSVRQRDKWNRNFLHYLFMNWPSPSAKYYLQITSDIFEKHGCTQILEQLKREQDDYGATPLAILRSKSMYPSIN